MKNHLSLAAFLICMASFPMTAFAQTDYSKVQIQTTPLGHNMYALAGAGGNITVAVGSDSIIMVDTEFAPLHDKIKAAVTAISPLPIKYVINTHYHGDHTGGNELFAKDGATFVSTANLANRLKNPLPGADGKPGTPAPAVAVPTQTYSGETHQVTAGGVVADLEHPPSAHTDTDSIVIWKAANVICTGDIISSASYPNIDVAAGGSINGMIAGADYILAHSDAATKVVPGHGPVTDRAGVMEFRTMLVTARDRIAKAKAGGMTADQVMNANLLADLDVKWKPNASPVQAQFPRRVYESVK
jgi:glyoxylase-like metal-dependent hydrolase (beta-lactamase superfamily II)